MKQKKITQKILKEKFLYKKDTGEFYRKTKNGFKIVGSPDAYGYLRIMINKRSYKAHRLAWLYIYGELPNGHIDHIDKSKSNNAITNLRILTQRDNMRNATRKSNNTSGVTGVSFDKNTQKWISHITVDYKKIVIGTFQSFVNAVKARYQAEKKYNFLSLNKQSDAFLYLDSCNLLNSVMPDISVQRLNTANRSGVTGVSYCNNRSKWAAYISVDKKRISLGRFNRFEDAVKERLGAEEKYGWPSCCTTSTAYSYLKKEGLL